MHGSERCSIDKYNPGAMDGGHVDAGAMQRLQGWRRAVCAGIRMLLPAAADRQPWFSENTGR
jgi:hypothetical protein